MTLRERVQESYSKAFQMFKSGPRHLGISTQPTPEYEAWLKENMQPTLIKPRIKHPKIESNARIRRFMDLPKFLDLISNRRLVLPSIRQLREGDPFECAARPDYSKISREELERRLLGLREFIPKHAMPDEKFSIMGAFYAAPIPMTIEQMINAMSVEKLREAVWCVEHTRLQRELVCSCWYGSGMESDAMWRLYCEQVGVSISTTVSRLKASISYSVPKILAEHFELSLEPVEYRDAEFCGDSLPWLVKRHAFEHEREIRLFADYPYVFPPGLELLVEPRKLIESYTVTPYAKKWQADVIENTAKQFLTPRRVGIGRNGAPKCIRSTHLDASAPEWPKNDEGPVFTPPVNPPLVK
jgi:hypothetical protein